MLSINNIGRNSLKYSTFIKNLPMSKMLAMLSFPANEISPGNISDRLELQSVSIFANLTPYCKMKTKNNFESVQLNIKGYKHVPPLLASMLF